MTHLLSCPRRSAKESVGNGGSWCRVEVFVGFMGSGLLGSPTPWPSPARGEGMHGSISERKAT